MTTKSEKHQPKKIDQSHFENLMAVCRAVADAAHEEAPKPAAVYTLAAAIASSTQAEAAWDEMIAYSRARLARPTIPTGDAILRELVDEVGKALASGAIVPGAPSGLERLRDLYVKAAARKLADEIRGGKEG